MIDSPFGDDDPIVLLPAIKPDVALFHAAMADRFGNVWIGQRSANSPPWRTPRRKTVVTVDMIHDGNLMEQPALAAGTLPGF